MKYTFTQPKLVMRATLVLFLGLPACVLAEGISGRYTANAMCPSPMSAAVDEDADADITVTGVVSDAETGQTLPGVNVIIKGTSQGTATDAEGRYSLVVPEDAVLVFSSI